MDGFLTHVTARTCLGFLLLILLQTSTEAQSCSLETVVTFKENNIAGDVVKDFNTSATLTLLDAGDSKLFRIDGTRLIANEPLDREVKDLLKVTIRCTPPAGIEEERDVYIHLEDVNDNSPEFGEPLYEITVSELTPVDTLVGRFAATDPDDHPQFYYTLKPDSSAFKLRSPTNPDILVAAPLEYHKLKNVTLTLEVQDEAEGAGKPIFKTSTTIDVTITDVDNRQPWFKPCEELDVDGIVVCPSPSYTGMVVLNKQEPGPLELKPGPLYAIDGDSGINEAITYLIVSGDDTGLFAINNDTGNITMQKATDVLGDIVLTVRASQKVNMYQFTLTTVTISVLEESFHPPVFEKLLYEGVVAEAGSMVMNLNNRLEPLRIIATDEDYIAVGGVNPHITYSTSMNNDFQIIGGYLFLVRDLPEATLPMQVTALDTTNDQSATAQLEVKVESGLTTTTKAPPGTTTKGGSVPDGTTTSHIPSSPWTTPPKTTTTNPSGPTGGSVAPTKPSQTSQGGATTTSTAKPYTGPATTRPPGIPTTTSKGEYTSNTNQGPATGPPGNTGSAATGGSSTTTEISSGDYELSDMLALGLTLGILLLICLVIIILLACHIKRRKQDWEKIYETTVFRSSLGIGPQKDGIQYINKAFQNDYDEVKLGSHGPEEPSKKADVGFPVYETVQKSSVLLPDILSDNTSQASSDKSDDEKEVKPILTKERRSEDGYKAVWFKEDIHPDDKVEVVIIPDSRGNDSEVEDDDAQSSSREVDTDLDSEIESKTGDQTDDSEDDRELSINL